MKRITVGGDALFCSCLLLYYSLGLVVLIVVLSYSLQTAKVTINLYQFLVTNGIPIGLF